MAANYFWSVSVGWDSLQFVNRVAVSTDQNLQNLTQDFVGMLSGGEEPA